MRVPFENPRISPAMAANAPPELASGNPCCLAVSNFSLLLCSFAFPKKNISFNPPSTAFQWQGKYVAMKKRRDYCKEAIDILQKAIGVANDEKANLEKSKWITIY